MRLVNWSGQEHCPSLILLLIVHPIGNYIWRFCTVGILCLIDFLKYILWCPLPVGGNVANRALQDCKTLLECYILTPLWYYWFPTPDQALALLHLCIDNFLRPHRTVILHLLLVAKRNIVQKWKSSDCPSLIKTIRDLSTQCAMERWSAHKHGSYQTFYAAWCTELQNPKGSLSSHSAPQPVPDVI